MKRKMSNITEIQATTIVRLIVLVVSIINLFLSTFTDFKLPGLNEAEQQAIATIITAIAGVIAYWYNNSWSENATTADKILDMLNCTDTSIDDVMESIEIIQNIHTKKDSDTSSSDAE